MRKIQGDLILVYKHAETVKLELVHTLTLVHVVDVDRHEMRMVNRTSKTRKPDWPFNQLWYDKLRQIDPASNKARAKWEVTLKQK